MIERHYGALLDGAGADIAGRLDASTKRRTAPKEVPNERITSPREVEGVRQSIGNLSERIKELADRLPDERWFNLQDYEELLDLRASLDTAAEEAQHALERWG